MRNKKKAWLIYLFYPLPCLFALFPQPFSNKPSPLYLSRHGLYCKVKDFMRLCLKIAMLIYHSD
uniref:Uncharacterized protein n=1 Tax=Anguilla anguilla TaxID=7936 RepID=A0A0E9X8A1_ANGAN